MSVILDLNEQKDVAERVRDALAKYQPSAYTIDVKAGAIVRDDDWYHVLVTTPNHERDRAFYDALVSAEKDLERASDGAIHYLLVPVLG